MVLWVQNSPSRKKFLRYLSETFAFSKEGEGIRRSFFLKKSQGDPWKNFCPPPLVATYTNNTYIQLLKHYSGAGLGAGRAHQLAISKGDRFLLTLYIEQRHCHCALYLLCHICRINNHVSTTTLQGVHRRLWATVQGVVALDLLLWLQLFRSVTTSPGTCALTAATRVFSTVSSFAFRKYLRSEVCKVFFPSPLSIYAFGAGIFGS